MYFFAVNLIDLFFSKYLICFIIKYACVILVLNILFYYNFFINLKNLMVFNFKSLIDLTASHYPDLLNEFELNYCLLSYKLGLRLFSRLLAKKEDLIISLNNIFSSANWLERELWDMFGVKFIFHVDLRRILTDYGFLGHPLLKYFPLSGFYELRFDELCNKVIKELLELAQVFRIFNYINPWVRWYNNNSYA